MNRFHPSLSELIKKRFEELGVETMLGSRAVIPAGGFGDEGEEVEVRTEDGRSLWADCAVRLRDPYRVSIRSLTCRLQG